MTRVVIVGEIYNAGLEVGGGPMPGGPGGAPPGYWGGSNPHPDQGLPGQQPGIDNSLPGQQPQPGHPIAPGGQPPRPSQGPGFPTNPIALPPGGQPVPPDVVNPGPIPPQYANQAIVAIHLPGKDWEVKTYPIGPSQGPVHPPQPGQPPQAGQLPSGQPQPTPRR